jgi:signal transduction histidine kinase/CheY-like chemotaxis protein
MLDLLKRLARPPDLGDADANRVARTQHWVLSSAAVLSILLLVVVPIFRKPPIQSVVVYIGAAIFACSGFALLHAKRARAAGFVFSGGFWILGALALVLFGVSSGALILHLLAIIFAGFFWSAKGTNYFVVASVLWLGVVAYADTEGVLPERAVAPPYRLWISVSFCYALVAGIVQLAFKGIDDALEDARRSADEAGRSKAALEASLAEQRRSDDERLRLERELEEARRLEALGRLAGGVAHDFNNLLTVVLTNAAVLKRDGRSVADGTRLAEIEDAARRASTLTRQLLAVGGRQLRKTKVVRLTEVVRAFEPLLRRLLPANVELTFCFEDDVPPILADETQLEQVLVNLVANARDSMPDGGVLSVAVASLVVDDAASIEGLMGVGPGTYALLRVADTGTGMDEETRRSIFEPFFTTKPSGRGTGLGLATVHGIVTQSSGHVWVESEPGHGSQFIVIFPASAEEGVEPASAHDSTARVKSMGMGGVVLLVEDEASVRAVLHRALEDAGFDVRSVESAEAALEAHARMAQLDLLVTDVVMPGTPGTELALALRDERPELRVLLVSGYTADALAEGPPFAGAAFLHKPFSADTLVHALQRLLAEDHEGLAALGDTHRASQALGREDGG